MEVDFSKTPTSLKIKDGKSKDDIVLGLVNNGYSVQLSHEYYGIGNQDNTWVILYSKLT